MKAPRSGRKDNESAAGEYAKKSICELLDALESGVVSLRDERDELQRKLKKQPKKASLAAKAAQKTGGPEGGSKPPRTRPALGRTFGQIRNAASGRDLP